MHKPVCVKCQCDFQVKRVGAQVVEMAVFGPYKIWDADMLACPGCGTEIVAQFAEGPASEHYMPGFASLLEAVKEQAADRLVYDYERPQKVDEGGER